MKSAVDSDGSPGTKQLSTHHKGASEDSRIDVSMLTGVCLIWLDNHMDANYDDYQNTITQLRCVVDDIQIFKDSEQCVQFLRNMNEKTVYMVISSAFAQDIVPRVHSIHHVHSILIICDGRQHYEHWAKAWFKIKGVLTEIQPICEAIQQLAQELNKNTIPADIMNTDSSLVEKIPHKSNLAFLYGKILKKILLTIYYDKQDFDKFIQYCGKVFANNERELIQVDAFRQGYHNHTPIYWFTSQPFLYKIVNRALCTMDVDVIIKLSFFISDLHRQIEKLHKEQFGNWNSDQSFMVYAGKKMAKDFFEKSITKKDKLLRFKTFLSTTKNLNLAQMFIDTLRQDSDSVGVLFVIKIDPTQSITSFASTVDCAYSEEDKDEDKILFSTHSVFRIENILHKDKSFYEVELSSIDNSISPQLDDQIREVTSPHETGWAQLAAVLMKMGELQKAQQVYKILLEQEIHEDAKGLIYNQLGIIKAGLEEYSNAIDFYERSIKIEERLTPANHGNLTESYNNIANVYDNIGDYSRALSYLEKALTVQQQSLPPTHPNLVRSYNSIGATYLNTNTYLKAFSYFEKALAIQQQTLPPNHLEFASTYDNIGQVHKGIRTYSKAHSFFERAVNIAKQSLPSNHPDLQKYQKHLEDIKETL